MEYISYGCMHTENTEISESWVEIKLYYMSTYCVKQYKNQNGGSLTIPRDAVDYIWETYTFLPPLAHPFPQISETLSMPQTEKYNPLGGTWTVHFPAMELTGILNALISLTNHAS